MRMSTTHTNIFDPAYVSGVLGIEVPLNESVLHSDEYRRRVIEEQLLMEGFFSDIKKLGGDLKNAALTLKGIMQDPSRISEFVEEVFSSMQAPFEKVTQWIDEIKESILSLSENEKWKKHLETATNWINSLSDKVSGLVEKVKSMSGWKQAIMAAAASVGITYLWDLLKDEGQEATKQIINATSITGESRFGSLSLFTNFLFEEAEAEEAPKKEKLIDDETMETILDSLKSLMKAVSTSILESLAFDAIAAAVGGGIAVALKWMGQAFGGIKLVLSTLSQPLANFAKAKKEEGDADMSKEEKNESLVRAYVRQLLKEDAMGFVHDLAASDKFGDQFRGGQVSKEAGREIKHAFNKNADHQFLSTLDTVHWATTYDIDNLVGNKGKDELSATMTLPGDTFVPAAGLEVGLWIKGRITLATNDQDKMYSGFYGDYGPGREGTEEEVVHRDKSSGRNKRPSVSKDYSRYGQLQRGNEHMEKMARDGIPYVLDQSTWKGSEGGWGTVNEALVDNWKPIGIIVSRQDAVDAILETAEKLVSGGHSPPSGNTAKDIDYFSAGVVKKIMLTALELGAPIYDTSRNVLWSPKSQSVSEALLRKTIRTLLEEKEQSLKHPTVGAVLDAIEVVQEIEGEEEKKEALVKLEKNLGWRLAKMLPYIGPAVGLARDVAGIYKTVKDTTRGAPEKLDDPILDLFHVDPGYKEMIDDSVEYEFDKDMMGYLNSLPRDAPLPDMTQELEKWIQKKFDRKISGAEVTESLLRKIIREQILQDTRYD